LTRLVLSGGFPILLYQVTADDIFYPVAQSREKEEEAAMDVVKEGSMMHFGNVGAHTGGRNTQEDVPNVCTVNIFRSGNTEA
jgi:hypothetical protein